MKIEIDYYYNSDIRISFYLVAQHHIRQLKKLNIKVRAIPLACFDSWEEKVVSKKTQKIAIIHPFILMESVDPTLFDRIMAVLGARYSHIFIIDVADFDQLSHQHAACANHPYIKGIMVPSLFSQNAFVRSGIQKPIAVVPHGIERAAPSSRFEFLQKIPNPKLLSFLHLARFRKGMDLLDQLVQQFPDLTIVIKKQPQKNLEKIRTLGRIIVINDFLSLADLASLYCNASFYVSLHRGGAFELNCVEAAAYGLPVICTGYGCVLEYLNPQNAFLVDVEEMVPIPKEYKAPGTCPNPSLKSASHQLRHVMTHYTQVKSQAQNASAALIEHYTWENAAKGILNFIQTHI